MRKKFVRVMFFGALALATSTSFVGCKDYDDDINRLEQKIEENTAAIEKINKLIESGSVITKVEDVTGGVKVTLSNGDSFTINNGNDGKDGVAWTIGDDGFWYQNGTKTDKKAIGKDGVDGKPGTGTPGTPGQDGDTYIPGEDGFWYLNEIKPENKTDKQWIAGGVVTAVEFEDHYVFANVKQADGTYKSVTVNKYSVTFVASLVHVPTNINADLGDVVFLPVIGLDENSTSAKVYEYNKANQPKWRTLVNGWAEYTYKVNPASVNPAYFDAVTFIEQTATTTRAITEIGSPLWKIASKDKGLLTIKATAGNNTDNFHALNMFKNGANHDDPDGKPASESSKYGEAGKVNTLAFMIKNTNESEKLINDGKVVSDFVPTKRMVVEQKDVQIGIAAKDDNLNSTVVAPNYVKLADLYTLAQVANKDSVSYLQNLAPIIEVLYTDEPVLDTYIREFAKTFHTNTGFTASGEKQWSLTELGFENINFKYSLAEYEQAEVNQSKRYLTVDKETGKIVVTNDVDGNKQTAAINRTPVIKVDLYVDNIYVMSKLLKIKLVETKQLTADWVDASLKDQTLGCTPLIGGGDNLKNIPNAKVVEGLKIDFDTYFNKLGVSKDKFVELYSLDGITGFGSSLTVTKDGNEFNDWTYNVLNEANLVFDYDEILGNATSDNNYLYFGLRNQLKAGTYKVKIAFETQSTIAKYKSFTITASFKVLDPKPEWTHNPSMWENKDGNVNMLAYGKPTKESDNYAKPFEGPFLMTAAIEDGFTKFDGKDLGECGTICFELVNPAQYNGDVTLTYVNGKHMLTIKPYVSKWVEKAIRVRATVYVDGITGLATTLDKTKRKINAVVDIVKTTATPSEFDVIFRDPVSYTEVNDGSWYMVDKAADSKNEGSYLPVYRLFKLWDTHKEQTNGMMWDPSLTEGWFKRSNMWIGKSLYDTHNVSVAYSIDADKNLPYVLQHATVDSKGLLKWSNAQGEAVVTDQPVVVTLTLKHWWNGNGVKKDITVNVKRANTEYVQPTPGFINDWAMDIPCPRN